MKRHKFPFIVTSNIFLLFPMIAALYVQEWFYFVFSILLFIASVGFHYTFYHNKKDFSLSRFLFRRKKHRSERFFRVSDWILASTGAGYVFYYIYSSEVEMNTKWFFATCFSLTLLFFVYTFKVGNYDKTHPWFHVLAQTLLGFIVLFL